MEQSSLQAAYYVTHSHAALYDDIGWHASVSGTDDDGVSEILLVN